MPHSKKRISERRSPRGTSGNKIQKIAVVARAYFEANTFNVAEYPSGVLLAQGFETVEQAQDRADAINKGK